MPKITLIARLSDGMPLVASMADEKDAYVGEVRIIVCSNDDLCVTNTYAVLLQVRF